MINANFTTVQVYIIYVGYKVMIKYAKLNITPNKMLIPTTKVDLEEYNFYCRYYNSLYEQGEINQGFILTHSRGISIDKKSLLHNLNCYEVFKSNAMHEICVITAEGMARIQYWHGTTNKLKPENSKISGTNAFNIFRDELRKDGIRIEDYYLDPKEGRAIKETIPSPLIKVSSKLVYNKIFDNAHHIDINQAYPYAMTLLYPEWTPTILRLYEKRHTNKKWKAVLNYSYGYFQAKHFGCKLANVSKFCIEETISRLNAITEVITKGGGTVLAYNTDGIWYTGDILPLPVDQQTKLGGLKHDHVNCRIRFKSDGAYEYIEDGKVYPVVRGSTNFDTWKSRDQWEWGDIYKATINMLVESSTEYGVIQEVRTEA